MKHAVFRNFSILCIFFCSNIIIAQYIPIALVHGILSDKYAMKPTEKYIQKYIPGTYVRSFEIGDGEFTSLWNMYDQVAWLAVKINNDYFLKNGFNMICHSQGGLIGRYYVERYNNPRVYNYISWGSPQAGIFGTPSKIDEKYFWLNALEKQTYRILYSTFFQNYVSFAGYWHDTEHHDEYLKYCCFLPYVNNEKKHPYNEIFKNNICSLCNMVLVMSPDDDIIEPVESCHFGFYKEGSHHEIEPLRKTDLYKKDTLGLRTLDESGRLHLLFTSGSHFDYQGNEPNFIENTLPFLKLSLEDMVAHL